MPVTPLFSFRPTPDVVSAIQTIQALLSQRSGRDVGKTAAIAYAVQRAAEDLQAKADREQRQEERKRPVGGIGGELAKKQTGRQRWPRPRTAAAKATGSPGKVG